MKILQVITSLHTGGAEKLIVDMVPKYRACGYEVDILLFDGAETPFKEELKAAGVNIFELGRNRSVYTPTYIFKLIPFLRKYDIVHTHNTAPQLFAAIAGMLSNTLLITTEHNTSNRRRAWKYYRPIDCWMYSRYQAIICISDAAETNLRSYLGRDINNILTIYNGVDVRRFRQSVPNQSLRIESGNKCVVVMVAGFRQQKDQDTLIRAFKHLPKERFELWLVGDGERRPVLEELVRNSHLQHVVKFLGIRSDIPSILKAADIIVMSSHYEGLSLSNIEGMSVGKPFVASDVDGLREITKDYGVLFEHGNDEQLAHCIQQLEADPKYSERVAERCWQRAQQYDMDKMVNAYVSLYKELLSKRDKQRNV